MRNLDSRVNHCIIRFLDNAFHSSVFNRSDVIRRLATAPEAYVIDLRERGSGYLIKKPVYGSSVIMITHMPFSQFAVLISRHIIQLLSNCLSGHICTKVNLSRHFALSIFCGYYDDSIRTTSTINSCGRTVFKDINLINVIWRNLIQITRNAIDKDKRGGTC